MDIGTKTPVDKQSALFASRRRHTNTVTEALEQAVNYLLSGHVQRNVADIFTGGFGPEPKYEFTVTIRKDAATPGTYSYTCKSAVRHHLGEEVKLHGLLDK